MGEHGQMNLGPLMAGEADKANLTLLPRLVERFNDPVGGEVMVRIVVVYALVDLPEVEMIGLQPAQRRFELAHRLAAAPAMGADFGHQEHAVAAVGDRL